MSYSAPGYSGPREIHYLFVDAASLRGKLDNTSRKYFGGKAFRLDFTKLLSVSGLMPTKIFYYDALPVRNDNEDEASYNTRTQEQRELLDSAAGVDRIHVYEGDARKRRRGGLKQKKVDVMITVDMLTHSFRRNMHKATLLTGDNDFKPLIDALVQDGMFVTLWYPTGETSKELMNAADRRIPLGFYELYELLSSVSRLDFSIPVTVNKSPTLPEPGTQVCEWFVDRVRHVMNKECGDYIILRDHDESNRLHIRHSDINLLRAYCKERFNMDIPQF